MAADERPQGDDPRPRRGWLYRRLLGYHTTMAPNRVPPRTATWLLPVLGALLAVLLVLNFLATQRPSGWAPLLLLMLALLTAAELFDPRHEQAIVATRGLALVVGLVALLVTVAIDFGTL